MLPHSHDALAPVSGSGRETVKYRRKIATGVTGIATKYVHRTSLGTATKYRCGARGP